VELTRSEFTRLIAAASIGSVSGRGAKKPAIWRGFNLQEKFTDTPAEWANLAPEWGRNNEPFREADFESIAELGFNFVRLPMSYRCWSDPAKPYVFKESCLREIDQAVAWGRRYGIHVCLNFHRAPGFCINQSLKAEPWNLWTDRRAMDIFNFHWRMFAQRYKGVPADQLSFNLLNEPNRCTMDQYVHEMREALAAIRDIDQQRLVVIDGLFGEAMLPIEALATVANTVQSARGYAPFGLTHYLAPWAGTPRRMPAWPFPGNPSWNKQELYTWCIRPWLHLEQLGEKCSLESGVAGTELPMRSPCCGCGTCLRCGRPPDGAGRCGVSGAPSAFWTATVPTSSMNGGADTCSTEECWNSCASFNRKRPPTLRIGGRHHSQQIRFNVRGYCARIW
jgi:endoglucanase